MARTGLSNRERKALRKATPAAPRKPKGEVVVKVAVAGSKKKPAADKEDGLLWLTRKGWITPKQGAMGLHYSDLARAAPDGGIKIVDLEGAGGGGSVGGGLPFGGSYSDGQAALELYVIRQHLLAAEPDLLLVMEGVCVRRHTPRFLAGGNQCRAHELLSALRIALNILIKVDDDKKAAERAREERRTKAA
jgi:hypothetical protein